MEAILEIAEMVQVVDLTHVKCRDKGDVGIIGIAGAGKSDYIVTEDADPTEAGSYRSIRILSSREIW